jgi:Tfp pilus assembly protein PilF
MRCVVSILAAITLVFGVGCASSQPDSSASDSRSSADRYSSKQAPDPLQSLTLMRQGSLLLQQGQYTEALNRFREADRIAPGNATVHNMIGLCHLRMQQFDKALVSFNVALDLIPSYTDARNNRGAAYLALGQYRLAEVDFLAVLGDSTYPHRWSVYYNLGMTYLRRGQLGAAEENLLKAANSPRPVFESFLRLAEISQQQGHDAAAEEYLQDARLRFPERLEAGLRLGQLLVEQGRHDEARPYLEEVVEKAAPTSEFAELASSLLTQL